MLRSDNRMCMNGITVVLLDAIVVSIDPYNKLLCLITCILDTAVLDTAAPAVADSSATCIQPFNTYMGIY